MEVLPHNVYHYPLVHSLEFTKSVEKYLGYVKHAAGNGYRYESIHRHSEPFCVRKGFVQVTSASWDVLRFTCHIALEKTERCSSSGIHLGTEQSRH